MKATDVATSVEEQLQRWRIVVLGTVQGVGFRPFVYRLAQSLGLTGFVRNNGVGVLIEAQGAPERLNRFVAALRQQAPAAASLQAVQIERQPLMAERTFQIVASEQNTEIKTEISPDLATCEDCLSELFDPHDRRHHYPFLNCTNCGPRFTIIRRLPYDREHTTMSSFALCEACAAEYHTPTNRRFHAQPNACPECGPKVHLLDVRGRTLATQNWLEATLGLLKQGKIVAVMGLGGFHLAVDPTQTQAIERLRKRKHRPHKPLALMAADLEVIKRYCFVTPEEESALTQPARPIVLLRRLPECKLPETIAPGQKYLGFMLPYTPLHHLLLSKDVQVLVLTSGNDTDEPIAISFEEAHRNLQQIADAFLVHNRPILRRCDDSVVLVVNGQQRQVRRSRGFVPASIPVPFRMEQPILACGGELKNTIALGRGQQVILSQHIGDLSSALTFDFFEETVSTFCKLFGVQPRRIACDAHPDYHATLWARKQSGVELFPVQHHHAHLSAVLAENQCEAPAIGIVLDGTGYGLDGTIWGGEVLVGNAADCVRAAHLLPFGLPGGDQAVRQPWRTALAVCAELGLDEADIQQLPFLSAISSQELKIVRTMVRRKINTPFTSSCGRLFDAVAALLNLRTSITYEAQAAIELEMLATDQPEALFSDLPAVEQDGLIDWRPLLRRIVEGVNRGEMPAELAARFHYSLAELFVRAACLERRKTGISLAVLSGGVMQNRLMSGYLERRLGEEGFRVLINRLVPANDGGLALGQVAVAAAKGTCRWKGASDVFGRAR